MTESDGQERRGRWIAATVVLAALLVGGLGLLTLRPDAGAAPRRWIKALDRSVLGGAIHRRLAGDPPTRDEHLDVGPAAPGAYAWAGDGAFLAVAHRLGPFHETGANTLPTYRRGRELGFRTFEVDLTLTADGALVCHHGRPDEVLDTLTWDGYRLGTGAGACRFEDLVEIARADPGVRFVLDVKNRFHEAYDAVLGALGEEGPGRAFIPQIYHFAQARRFREEALLAGAVFTAYRSALSVDEVFEYARRAGIEVVTLPVERLSEWDGPLPQRPMVLAHPVNDAALALRLRERGVDGIYTGYLAPPILEALLAGSRPGPSP